MAKKKSESSAQGYWFDIVSGICFSDPLLDYTNFMLLYLAPATVTCGKNYGKTTGRTAGRAKKGEEIKKDKLVLRQKEFLNFYTETLKEISVDDSIKSPADRAKELVEKLTAPRFFVAEDKEYGAKPENCTEDRYLGMFTNVMHAGNRNAKKVMDEVVAIYASIAGIVYAHTEKKQLSFIIDTLQTQILAAFPELRIQEHEDEMTHLGWLMCTMLLLQAWKKDSTEPDCALMNGLLGLELEAAEKVVQPQKRNIALEIPMFRNLCMAALRSKMQLQEMQDFYNLLKRIHQTMPECLTPDIVNAFSTHLSEAYQEQIRQMPTIDNANSLIDVLKNLQEMEKTCQEILRAMDSV